MAVLFRAQPRAYAVTKEANFAAKPIGFQNQTHWVLKWNPLGFTKHLSEIDCPFDWKSCSVSVKLEASFSQTWSEFQLKLSAIRLELPCDSIRTAKESAGIKGLQRHHGRALPMMNDEWRIAPPLPPAPIYLLRFVIMVPSFWYRRSYWKDVLQGRPPL